VVSFLGSTLRPGTPAEGEPIPPSVETAAATADVVCATSEGAKLLAGIDGGAVAVALAGLAFGRRHEASLQALGTFFTCGAPLDESVLRPVWGQCGVAAGHASTGDAIVAILADGSASPKLKQLVRYAVAGISCRTWASREMVRTPRLVEAVADAAALRDAEEGERGMACDAVTNLLQSLQQEPTEVEEANATMRQAGMAFIRRVR